MFPRGFQPECTKIARLPAAAAAIFTAPGKIARLFEAPRCAISSAKKIASEPRFLLRWKRVKMILAAEFLAKPSSAVKIASERRCAILVHSGSNPRAPTLGHQIVSFSCNFATTDMTTCILYLSIQNNSPENLSARPRRWRAIGKADAFNASHSRPLSGDRQYSGALELRL